MVLWVWCTTGSRSTSESSLLAKTDRSRHVVVFAPSILADFAKLLHAIRKIRYKDTKKGVTADCMESLLNSWSCFVMQISAIQPVKIKPEI